MHNLYIEYTFLSCVRCSPIPALISCSAKMITFYYAKEEKMRASEMKIIVKIKSDSMTICVLTVDARDEFFKFHQQGQQEEEEGYVYFYKELCKRL
jgi:hypothetical protein